MYNRESKIMRKLLGKVAPDSTTGNVPSITRPTSPVPGSYRPSKSQNAVYVAGAPISCFDVSPDRRAAVLAGPHILKTVVLDNPMSSDFSFSEGIDVRTAITTRQPTGPRSNVAADQLNIRDIKWHDNSHIYTACASGKVFAYDLARLGAGDSEPLEYILMQEDSRQMNSLDINPHLKTWLLTGGQDGTARVFDSAATVSARHGISFRQRFAPLRCIDPIRQVRWSPTQGHEMACCTDSGVVMKWDVRQPSRPVLRINAHEKACSSIAWHTDGTHLISAGWDTRIHTWDLGSTADKRQKPKWTISAPAPVTAVAWRPGLWSASAQARRVAQIAVTYDETSNRRYGTPAVHIWDLARPSMPYKEIERFDTAPSALAWQDPDMLWTVGQDGIFNQCDVAFSRKVIDRQSSSSMAFSPRGDVLMFLDERSQRHRLPTTHQPEVIHRATYSSSPGNQGLSISRSDSEDDILGSFLGPRRKVARKRRLSGRGAVSLSTTPPSGGASFSDDSKQQLSLEQSINMTGIFKSQQVMSFGHIPAAKTVDIYHFLSHEYLEILRRELPQADSDAGKPLVDRVGIILAQYAGAAENANLYRLAQTWRILAYAMNLLLKRRAQYHLECRVGQFQKLQVDDGFKGADRLKHGDQMSESKKGPRSSSGQRGSVDERFHPARSLLAEEIESTSNVTTPAARPRDGGGDHGQDDSFHQHGRKLSPILEPGSLNIGPAAHGSFGKGESPTFSPRRRLDSQPLSTGSETTDKTGDSYVDGYDFYDADVLAKAIDVPMRKKVDSSKAPPYRGRTARHDSDESSNHMFSVSNGTKRSQRMGSSGDAFARPGLGGDQPEMGRDSGASSAESPAKSKLSREMSSRSNRSGELSREIFMIDEIRRSRPSFASQDSGNDSAISPCNSAQGIATSRPTTTKKRITSPRHDPRPYIVDADYLAWEDDPPYPHPLDSQTSKSQPLTSPLDPYNLLTRALDFESRTSALNASAMILLLKPIVPDSVIEPRRATAILRQHHSRLMGMSLFVEAALLRNLCVQGWPDGLPDWGVNYTGISSSAQQGVKVGLFCVIVPQASRSRSQSWE